MSPAWSDSSIGAKFSLTNACPTGYTVPSGGTAGGGSDISYTPISSSAAWGYYADGFFDRRQIVASPTSVAASTVSSDDDIAYRGRLLYNSTTNASLFLPAAGSRHSSVSSLGVTGSSGYYWSSTENATNSAYILNLSITALLSTTGNRTYGFSVRCVTN